MAHIKSAKKRARQTIKITVHHKAIRTFFRDQVKLCHQAIAGGNLEQARAALKKAGSAIARARSKGILHKNTASRYISRLSLELNKMAGKAQAKSGTV